VEHEDDGAVVSTYVDSAFKGCGVGQDMIEAACREAGRRWSESPMLAHMQMDNSDSIGFFERNSFSVERPLAYRAILRRMP
jgi:L-amino acid N-acyltransferase YncA